MVTSVYYKWRYLNEAFFYFFYNSCWVWVNSNGPKWTGSLNTAVPPPTMSTRVVVNLQRKRELRFTPITMVGRVSEQQKGEIFQYATQVILSIENIQPEQSPGKLCGLLRILCSAIHRGIWVPFVSVVMPASSWAVCDLELPAGTLPLLLVTECPPCFFVAFSFGIIFSGA